MGIRDGMWERWDLMADWEGWERSLGSVKVDTRVKAAGTEEG